MLKTFLCRHWSTFQTFPIFWKKYKKEKWILKQGMNCEKDIYKLHGVKNISMWKHLSCANSTIIKRTDLYYYKTKMNLVASFESFCIFVNLYMYLVSYHLKCFHLENMNLNCAIWNIKYFKDCLKYTVLLMFVM